MTSEIKRDESNNDAALNMTKHKTMPIDDVLLNLKIIAAVKKGDKIITSSNIIEIDSRYYTQPALRYWYGENRKETVKSLSTIVNNAFMITDRILKIELNKNTTEIKEYFAKQNSHKLLDFKHHMENACTGLVNLKETYRTDVTVCASIELLLSKLKTRVNKIQQLFSIDKN